MKGLKLVEDATLSGVHSTADGYLSAEVRCARTGIQEYSGVELGLIGTDRVRVYRPEEEVFSKASLATYAGKPATDDHPSQPVTAENWKRYAVGNIGNEVLRDGEYVKVPLILMDAETIRKVQAGKREISMGYLMDLSFESGTTPDGQEYDAIQRNLCMNHLAIVNKGRAGSAVRIGDRWPAEKTPKHKEKSMTTRTIVVDGLTVETTDAGAIAIEKLQSQIAKSAAELSEAQSLHDAALAGKDTALATKDAEIESLKAKVLDAAALDKLVADRAALINKAKAFAKDADFTGKSDLDIKIMAVSAVRGSDFLAGKSEAYTAAAFDMLELPAPTDRVRETLMQSNLADKPSADRGYSANVKNITDGWKPAHTGVAS